MKEKKIELVLPRPKIELPDGVDCIPFLDKKNWPPGPWHEEPDELVFYYKGFPCIILRNIYIMGNLCGYVGLRTGMHKIDTGKIDVHGGITYRSYSNLLDGVRLRYCPRGMKWMGFDCAHFKDIKPAYDAMIEFLKTDVSKDMPWEIQEKIEEIHKEYAVDTLIYRDVASYKDIEFVKKELCKVVDQIITLSKGKL